MTLKKLVAIAFLFQLSLLGWSQQTFKWSQYLMNTYSLNPAVGGLDGCLVMNAGYRMQWAGFEDAPRTMMISGHREVGKEKAYKKGWHGFGARIFRDTFGPFEAISIDPSYAYHLKVNKDWVFSAGIFVAFRQYTVNTARIRDNGGIVNEQDPVFQGNNVVLTYPIFTPGIWLNNTETQYYFGLSVEQVWRTRMSSWGGNRIGTDGRLANHYTLITGRRFQLTGYDMSLEPSILIQYRWLYPPSVDINFRWHLRQRMAFGVAYRNTEGVVGMIEMQLNQKWRLGYSFDFTTSKIRKGTNLYTHELALRFVHCFKNEPRPNMLCPAYD